MLKEIESLLSEQVTLNEQVAIIEQLNEQIFNPQTLYSLARYLLSKAQLIKGFPVETVDIVGTGGDGHNTLNFSTMSAIVTAACGYKVAKHGNKSSTSKCGSFDLLQRLGVTIPANSGEALSCLQKTGIAFLYGPHFHPILASVAEARKVFAKRGEKTIFNLMGPLINPVRPERMSVGVYREDLVEPYAQVLSQLGVQYGYVVHGDGLDEFSLTGRSRVATINEGQISLSDIVPEAYDLDRCELSQLIGGEPDQNYTETLEILSGQCGGPKMDMVIFNAASAIVVASGFKIPLLEGIFRARKALLTGRVKQFLQEICA